MILTIILALCLCRSYAYVDVYTEDRNLVECGGAYSSAENGLSSDEEIDHQNLMRKVVTAQVALVKVRGEEHSPLCSGILVTRRHVLTAALCFSISEALNVSEYSARIGHTNIDKGQIFDILSVKLYEGYTKERYYDDIALVTLGKAVEDPKIGVVCLPDQELDERNLTGVGLSVAGWGVNSFHSSTAFYLSTMRVVSNRQCNESYRKKLRSRFRVQFPKGISREMLCANYYEGEKSVCSGDAGGPLMLLQGTRWYVLGLVLFGPGCGQGDAETPIVSTRVSSYAHWIRNNINTCV